MFRNRHRRAQQGIAVVELFLVVAAIILLACLLWLFISGRRATARDAKREEDMRVLQNAIAVYAASSARYSPSGKSAESQCVTGAGCSLLSSCGDQIHTSSFLAKDLRAASALYTTPNDPRNPKYDPGPFNYYYASVPPNHTDYLLSYCLETNSIPNKKKGIQQVRP